MMNIAGLKRKLKKNKLARLCHMIFSPKPYPAFYEKCPVEKKTVLYESFYGKGMTCGPCALFRELMKQDSASEYTHVWVYDRAEPWRPVFEEYADCPNVKFVKIKSRGYYRYLASAGYLINNSTFPACFTRKPEQVYINTWHGIPLKYMGYDMPDGNIRVANTERNFLQTSFLLSPNSHHTKMYTKAYKLEGIFEGKIIETGQARTDTLLHSDRKQVIHKLITSGLQLDFDKKIIMYAPTWKGGDFSNPQADVEEYEKIYRTIQNTRNEDVQVLIKPHQAVYDKIKNTSEVLRGHLVSPYLDTNEVLGAVDILISDYSSIFFDFLVTKRPVMFYIPDLEEYKKTRGLYLPAEELPGPATDRLEELCEWLQNPEEAVRQTMPQYYKLIENFCQHDDGRVSERIVRAIWGGDFSNVKLVDTKTEKKKIFISLGRALQNGITHSFLSLLNNIDYEKYDVTAYLYEAVAPDQIVRMNEINQNVRVLVRTNYNFATRRELLRLALAMAFHFSGAFRKAVPEKYLVRQAKRLAGDAQFDSVVEFCGYSPILALVLPKLNTKKTAIWMHNDLVADADRTVNHRKPLKRKLTMIFHLYPQWDRLVSCSQSVMEVNQKNLSTPETADKFYYAKNTIHYRRVQDSLQQDVEYEGFLLPEKGQTSFVTMGRLSTEKNHGNLIRAFAKYQEQYPDSRLYIIGEGPLRQQLEAEIARLKLEESVILTGNLINPFVLMKQCSCFILPSVYEGQPMVLLEARIVGLPIIVSDFSSVKDSLMENGQYLIQSTEDSILEGLKAFSEGKVPVCSFDPEAYNREAVKEFEQAVL